MLIHDYLSDRVEDGKTSRAGKLTITKNKSGTNTLIENENEMFLIVDFSKLMVPVDNNNS